MKQPIKKKEFKRPSIASIKEKLNLTMKSNADLVKSAADKPMDFIPLPEAFSDAIKLPGIPKGYLTIVTGWSNTGKSTIKNCLIASCINNGILPVIYETENNFDFKYAMRLCKVYSLMSFSFAVCDSTSKNGSRRLAIKCIGYPISCASGLTTLK